jgi:hypothetical protein
MKINPLIFGGLTLILTAIGICAFKTDQRQPTRTSRPANSRTSDFTSISADTYSNQSAGDVENFEEHNSIPKSKRSANALVAHNHSPARDPFYSQTAGSNENRNKDFEISLSARHEVARTIVIPAALKKIDGTQIALSSAQWQAFDRAANQFADSIGGADQNPNDPAYAAKWVEQQPSADALLKARIGWQAYNGIQFVAARMANEKSLSASSH